MNNLRLDVNLQLNNNGQWVRLIPSLNGGLYKFDGDTLESLPVSVDQLLYSSFRYSDDLVFSGGKTLHTYRKFHNYKHIKCLNLIILNINYFYNIFDQFKTDFFLNVDIKTCNF